MKIIMIECNADEIRANRTLFDTITDSVRRFVYNFQNAGITSKRLAAMRESDE